MTQIARISDTGNERRLQAERLLGAAALQEAQALRFNVFSGEFNAKLKGAELGLTWMIMMCTAATLACAT